MKRTMTLLLAVLMLATCFLMASCENEPATGESSVVTSGETSQETALVPSLGETDEHKGKVLKVLVQDKEDVAFAREPFGASEVNSEPVNDACINRFAILEQTYGFTVESEFLETWTEFPERVEQDFMTGTAEYDVISGGLTNMAPFAAEGILMDLNSISDSNLSLKSPGGIRLPRTT